ncbi:MAG: N-acetyltransferase GCN5 [Erysipelotrichaceae bacterium]|nr:MAG: N-acetyltransferase [Erysipelotrichaceae bacterium]TXT18496.1 MAG: N-acetyltransferase GCN5 [Erysipelotrichaceae bacterium]
MPVLVCLDLFGILKVDMLFKRPLKLDDGEIRLQFAGKHVDPKKNGWGTSFIYDIVVLDKIVGRCDLRIGSGTTIDYAGHIGYSVYLPYRGHHYAAKACLLLFKQAKHMGMDEILITCNTDNIASYRTCELCGCTYIGTKPVPLDHELYLQGDREKALFIKHL